MSKRKYPSELNSRTIRVNIGDWQWLNSLSQQLGITVAEAFHKVITEQDQSPVQPAQIPMPVFKVRLQPTIATNGSKAAAFRIKPKGARYD